MEWVILLAQTGTTFWLAAWLTLGLRDNLVHPEMNETFTRQVLQMDRMRADFAEHYRMIAHRRVTSPWLQRALFWAIVAAEAVACLVLWVGVVWLGLALAGLATPETARAAALLGALLFTSVWSGFLVAGNHFAYWYCHEGAQNTHFQMTIWGTAAMIFLAFA
ncbi:MAG: DUF2165 family protein [Pseudomonadota bacterium]